MVDVLVVEDEPAIAESVVYALGKAGFSARFVTHLAAAEAALEAPTDLIILDLMLPDGSGLDFIETVAKRPVTPAIIVLSSRDAEADRVRALESGADDYVTKPFSPREIVARARAVLRRADKADAAESSERLTISQETRRATLDAQVLDLTRVEFDLLALLFTKPGHVFSRPRIIGQVWGSGFALSDRTIDSHIKALRRKLTEGGGKPSWIETERGVGYRITEPSSWPAAGSEDCSDRSGDRDSS